MAYKRNTKSNTLEIEKGDGFTINLPEKLDERFSIAYLNYTDARDPANKETFIALNKGYSGIYIVTEGTITFNVYENNEWSEQILTEGESIYLTEGTIYEIMGTGKITLINIPAHSDKTYSHPSRP